MGAVGSAAPWFLTGWAHEVEVEFMIDSGCQMTILATTIFERMCTADPRVRSRLWPCRSRLVLADSSPLTVKGELELNVVFLGLCVTCCSWWLQLHQQRLIPEVDGFLTTSVVLPPDSEIVAPFSVSGVRPNCCAYVEPSRTLMEEYGVIVGHTLVDASSRTASVLMVNSNAEEVVLPSFTCVGKLVPVSAISVALADPGLPKEERAILPEHLEDIFVGSHPSLGDSGRQLLRDLLYRYRHVFPAPGDHVTGRTTSVQHEILTPDAPPVRCGPRRLAPAGLRTEQKCVQDMLLGGQIEPSGSLWASPVVLVTKKDGSMHFCVDYRRLHALTTKDAYLLPRIDDSLRLLGNQQWFSTMDLASGYRQVAMYPDAKCKAAFVTNKGLFQFRVMPFGLCNAPAMFERLMDRVLCGMCWSHCLVYLDDVISFSGTVTEALARLEEVLGRLSNFGLQLKVKKCTFMQTEVVFLGHIVGRTGLACDPAKLSAVRNWHAPDKVKGVRQFAGFV